MMDKRNLTSMLLLFFLFASSVFLISGCGVKFWDPTQIGRFRPVPKVNVILDSLGVAEETPVAWSGAEEPKPSDLISYETDYVFGSGDLLRISIFELFRDGELFANSFVVTETGKISIPDVGVVQAEGLTESQLEEEISRILEAGILKKPSVSVTLASSQRRTFSILGEGVPVPGRYSIPRYDFRLADAVATGGGVSQFNISYVYVSRRISGREPLIQEAEEQKEKRQPEDIVGPEDEMLEVITPDATTAAEDEVVLSTSEMASFEELSEAALPDGFAKAHQDKPDSVKSSADKKNDTAIVDPMNQSGEIEWIFEDGKWIPKRVGEVTKEVTEQPERGPLEEVAETAGETFEWDEITGAAEGTRVIEIPADKLLAGDPRYNIVIRPGDTIHVPVDVIGEFYVMGNTNFQGAIRLTGRPMTLKMAMAAAGGLGPLAWPKHCEVIRRISRNKEEIVMVDLDKIASGKQPDFFIKPNDLINVGTHPTSRWRAVLRNAFRATYGFGFIYDRNFGFREFGINAPFGPFGSEWDPF